jgi:hypothetical protein
MIQATVLGPRQLHLALSSTAHTERLDRMLSAYDNPNNKQEASSAVGLAVSLFGTVRTDSGVRTRAGQNLQRVAVPSPNAHLSFRILWRVV